MLFTSSIIGDTPRHRYLRHMERAAEVSRSVQEVIENDEVLRAAAFDFSQEYGVPIFGYCLTWAEGDPAHWLGPNFTPPTERPSWWTAAQLPERRHRLSGPAWTSAAREAANLLLASLPDGARALLPLAPEAVFGALAKVCAQDAAYLAAAQAKLYHAAIHGRVGECAHLWYVPTEAHEGDLIAQHELWDMRAQAEGNLLTLEVSGIQNSLLNSA
jgi:hypothetical protein